MPFDLGLLRSMYSLNKNHTRVQNADQALAIHTILIALQSNLNMLPKRSSMSKSIISISAIWVVFPACPSGLLPLSRIVIHSLQDPAIFNDGLHLEFVLDIFFPNLVGYMSNGLRGLLDFDYPKTKNRRESQLNPMSPVWTTSGTGR